MDPRLANKPPRVTYGNIAIFYLRFDGNEKTIKGQPNQDLLIMLARKYLMHFYLIRETTEKDENTNTEQEIINSILYGLSTIDVRVVDTIIFIFDGHGRYILETATPLIYNNKRQAIPLFNIVSVFNWFENILVISDSCRVCEPYSDDLNISINHHMIHNKNAIVLYGAALDKVASSTTTPFNASYLLSYFINQFHSLNLTSTTQVKQNRLSLYEILVLIKRIGVSNATDIVTITDQQILRQRKTVVANSGYPVNYYETYKQYNAYLQFSIVTRM